MGRREFITLLGVVSVPVPRAGGVGVSMVARTSQNDARTSWRSKNRDAAWRAVRIAGGE